MTKPLKYYMLSFALISLFFSCKEKDIVIPESVLSKDTLAAVMVDLQLIEAMKVKKGINDSLSNDSLLLEYGRVFKKHNLNREQFDQSFAFYKEHPELLEEIYDKTINELSRLQAMLGNIRAAVNDSLNKKPILTKKQKAAEEFAKIKKSGDKKK